MVDIKIVEHVVQELPSERPLVAGHKYKVVQDNGDLLEYVINSNGEPVFVRGITEDQNNRLQQVTQSLIDKLSNDYTKEQIDVIVENIEDEIADAIVQSTAAYVPLNPDGSLPSPTTDNNFTMVGEGTYGAIVIPSNHLGILVWDGSSWSKVEEVEMPIQEGTDTLEEEEIPKGKAVIQYAENNYLKLADVYDNITREVAYVGSSLNQIGFIRPDGTLNTTNPEYRNSDFLSIPDDVNLIEVYSTLLSVSPSPIVFYDEYENYISGVQIPSVGVFNEEVTKPNGAKYIRCSCKSSELSTFSIKWVKIDFASNQEVDNKIADATSVYVQDIFDASAFTNVGFIRPDGTLGTNTPYSYTNKIDLTGITKIVLHTTLVSNSVSPAVFYDEDENYISGYVGDKDIYDYEITPPANARYFVSSISNTGKSSFKADAYKMFKYVDLTGKHDRIYISASGDDNNSGLNASNPIKTISKASELLSNKGELVFIGGDYFDYSFDFSSFSKFTGLGKTRIIRGTRFTSATPTSGYSRVYQVPYSTIINSNFYLWQHDIEDEETLISMEERHPFHRGRRTRLPSTRIYPASSIEEIESTADKLMWYQSGGILYFSITEDSDLSVNPIVIPSGLFSANRQNNVEVRNIDFMYCGILTTNLTGLFENVSCGMYNGAGAIRYDNTVGLVFRNTEAYGCSNDGFNGHTNSGYARTSVIFENCYAHDNYDDGESCHEYSDVIHKGGLYEYNGNGITPASGGHATCYNVIVRKSGSHPWSMGQEGTGFSAQGSSLDDGIGTNIYCFDCISQDNLIGYRGLLEGGSKAYNSLSINNGSNFVNIQQVECKIL